MLPFTTYSIPESGKNGFQNNGKWLCMLLDQPLSDTDLELLQKIASALKADFTKDVYCVQSDVSKNNPVQDTDLSGMKLIISFGVPLSTLGFWIDLPAPGIRILESCAVIRTVTLKSLAGSAVFKKDLWNAMQVFTASKNG